MENIDFSGKAITVQSSDGATTTVLDGNQAGSAAVCISGEETDTVLDGFTLLNGSGTADAYNQLKGGGMYIFSSSPTVKNCIFVENTADYGGGMYSEASDVVVIDCTFVKNEATWMGGGMRHFNGTTIHYNPTVTGCVFDMNTAGNDGGGMCSSRCDGPITDCIFTNNSVDDGYGGGLFIDQCLSPITQCTFIENEAENDGGGMCIVTGDLTVSDCLFQKNRSLGRNGGGLAWRQGFNQSLQELTNCVFTENEAVSGGGIACAGHAAPFIHGNTIINNTASDQGGGIYCDRCYSVISDNLVSENQAADKGGGISIYYTSAGMTIRNNSIARNVAVNTGGGIYCSKWCRLVIMNNLIMENDTITSGGGITCERARPLIINNTLFGNQTEYAGGGIFCSDAAEPRISNTILWNNKSWLGSELYLDGSLSPSDCFISYSNVAGGLESVYVDPNCDLNWGEGMIESDPLFVDPLQEDFHLQQDPCQPGVVNPCVDSGSTVAYGLCLHTSWTRTDGEPDGGTADMGIHYGPFSHPTLIPDSYQLPETGGEITFELIPGMNYFERKYLVLCGVSGTEPGTMLPGGHVILPVNLDAFTYEVLIPLMNSWVFYFLMLQLSAGDARAYIHAPPIPGYAGLKVYFAYCLRSPYDFVSNPVVIEVVP